MSDGRPGSPCAQLRDHDAPRPLRRPMTPAARRFPPPWSVDEADSKLDRRFFIVCDANGLALAYIYFEDEPGRPSGGQAAHQGRSAADGGQLRQGRPLADGPAPPQKWAYVDSRSQARRGLLAVQSALSQRAAASALSSGRVLNAIAASGAALCTALITASNIDRLWGGRRMPAPITTQS